MSRKFSKEEKEKLLKKFRNGDLSYRAFCKKNGVSKTTLSTWLRAERENLNKISAGGATDFGIIQLNAQGETSATDDKESIKFSCDTIRIELKNGYDKNLLTKVIEVMTYDK